MLPAVSEMPSPFKEKVSDFGVAAAAETETVGRKSALRKGGTEETATKVARIDSGGVQNDMVPTSETVETNMVSTGSCASADIPCMDLDPDFSTPPRPPPGFLAEEFDGKLPAWTGGAGREEKEKEKDEDGKEKEKVEDEASLKLVLKELREMRVDVDSKFTIVESSLLHFKNEIVQIR